jgi:hypothetical protein
LQNWLLKPSGTEGYRTAEVTVGGVIQRLSSKPCNLKLRCTYFIGEASTPGWLGHFLMGVVVWLCRRRRTAAERDQGSGGTSILSAVLSHIACGLAAGAGNHWPVSWVARGQTPMIVVMTVSAMRSYWRRCA